MLLDFGVIWWIRISVGSIVILIIVVSGDVWIISCLYNIFKLNRIYIIISYNKK